MRESIMREHNITQIVIGLSRSRWSAMLLGSIAQDLVSIAGDITFHVPGAAVSETATAPMETQGRDLYRGH